jgi:hypothetical protein
MIPEITSRAWCQTLNVKCALSVRALFGCVCALLIDVDRVSAATDVVHVIVVDVTNRQRTNEDLPRPIRSLQPLRVVIHPSVDRPCE